jgi:hypothetical protein
VVNTSILEARASLLHNPACLHDCETLSKSEALKILPTELYIVKDLTVRRLLEKGRREGLNASLDLLTEMGWAARFSSHGVAIIAIEKYNNKEFYLKVRLRTDSDSESRIAAK